MSQRNYRHAVQTLKFPSPIERKRVI